MYLTLYEYLEIADRVLGKYGVFDNEDARSFVASYMMKADQKFIEGRGDRGGFRGQYANFGAQTWLSKQKKQPKVLSLNAPRKGCNYAIDYHEREWDNCYLDGLTSQEASPENKAIVKEIIEYANTLPTQQKKCFLMRFVDSMTLQEIGDKCGFSRERARQVVAKAVDAIKEHFSPPTPA